MVVHLLGKGELIKRYGKFSLYSSFDSVNGFLHSYLVYLDNNPIFEDYPSFARGDPFISKDLVFDTNYFAVLKNGKTDIESLLLALN